MIGHKDGKCLIFMVDKSDWTKLEFKRVQIICFIFSRQKGYFATITMQIALIKKMSKIRACAVLFLLSRVIFVMFDGCVLCLENLHDGLWMRFYVERFYIN
jgi:hypothetical protein